MSTQSICAGYLFKSDSDHPRDRTVCELVGRVHDDDVLNDVGASFVVRFSDGALTAVPGVSLSPWFAVD